jgi:hypothetical protein
MLQGSNQSYRIGTLFPRVRRATQTSVEALKCHPDPEQ